MLKRMLAIGVVFVGGLMIGPHASAAAPSISHVRWGMAPSGKAVDLYTLTNASGMEVRIVSYGGTITSLKVPDKSGHLSNVVLGFDNLAAYTSPKY